jgi:hypothetical protein
MSNKPVNDGRPNTTTSGTPLVGPNGTMSYNFYWPPKVEPVYPRITVAYEVQDPDVEPGDETAEPLDFLEVTAIAFEDLGKLLNLAEHYCIAGYHVIINGNRVQVIDFELDLTDEMSQFTFICAPVERLDAAHLAMEVDAAIRQQTGRSYDA